MHDASSLRLLTVPWPAVVRLVAPLVDACGDVLNGAAAERVLDRVLRAHRDVSAEERRAAAEVVFGVGLWRRRLAWHVGAPDPSAADPRLLIFAVLTELGGVAPQDAAGWLALIEVPERRPPPSEPALRYSFPDWILGHLAREVGGALPALADAFNLPGPICFRANALVTARDALAADLAAEGVRTRPGSFAPDALVVDGPRPNIYGLEAYRRGAFEVQDEGSQLLGAIVQAAPGQRVLDYCAGAGGKALQLGGQLRNDGELHVFDVDPSRLERLERRAQRAGVTCLRVHRAPPPAALAADRVLVDAPCSELGALRRGPDLRFRISPDAVAHAAALQREILRSAAQHVRPGGTLVYATCSFVREENEDVVASFLFGHPAFTLAPLPQWIAPELIRDGFLRTWPHLHGTDAFFAAILQRSRSDP